MDRCALFIDAGYLLSDGAVAVHGTRHREQVSWDFDGLLKRLGELAREHSGLPLLRCYWYESTVEGRRGPEHEALADLPGLKLRLGRSRPGRRDGVDTELHRDLLTLARNHAISDAVVISGDEDLVGVLCDAQDLGVRVTIVHVTADGNWTISRLLRQECDDLVELGAGQLRPYVSLLSGLDRAHDTGPSPLSNGHGTTTGSSPLAALQDSVHSPSASHASPPSASPLTSPSAAPAAVSQLSAPISGAPSVLNGLTFGSKDTYGTQDPYSTQDPYGSQELSQPSYLSPSFGSSSSSSTGPTPVPSFGSSSSTGPTSVPSFGSSSTASTGPNSTPSYSPTSTSPSLPLPAQSSFTSPTSTGTGGLPAYPLTPPAAQPPASPPAPPQYGSYTSPNSLVPQTRASQAAPSLSDAVQAAHSEGQDFGESVARDAPALWLEAVLARKPRMPSDLEARLLQGSALPIDFLLHDEVRHALRRGFWDALERARR